LKLESVVTAERPLKKSLTNLFLMRSRLYAPLVGVHAKITSPLKRLEEESKRTGSSVAELVRKAIDAVYPEKAERK